MHQLVKVLGAVAHLSDRETARLQVPAAKLHQLLLGLLEHWKRQGGTAGREVDGPGDIRVEWERLGRREASRQGGRGAAGGRVDCSSTRVEGRDASQRPVDWTRVPRRASREQTPPAGAGPARWTRARAGRALRPRPLPSRCRGARRAPTSCAHGRRSSGSAGVPGRASLLREDGFVPGAPPKTTWFSGEGRPSPERTDTGLCSFARED